MAWLTVVTLNVTVGRSDVEPVPAAGSRFAIPADGLGFGRCARPRPGDPSWQVPWVQLVGPEHGVAGHNTLLRMEDGIWWAIDSDAIVGTTINGRRISRHPLEDGDTIEIAWGATLRFHHGPGS